MASDDLTQLLRHTPDSSAIRQRLYGLSAAASLPSVPSPQIKCYHDALYMNYFQLGLSLLFSSKDGSGSSRINKDDITGDKLQLDGIDIYNAAVSTSSSAEHYSRYPEENIVIPLATIHDRPRASQIVLTPTTTGKDIVACLGEPDRKGGGAGPSSGSFGIWCEWARDGIMIEFGGDGSSGPQAWERGKDALWKVLSIFPKSA